MHRIPGILVFSFLLILSGSVLSGREVELQFHQVKDRYYPSFKKLSRVGFDKIILRSFLNKGDHGGLLFPSQTFKTAYPGFSRILKKNKRRKYKLWGWLIARKYDWLRDTNMYDSRSGKRGRQRVRKLDLFQPGAREKVISVFRELAATGVEGILIQDDLAFASDEGFSDAGLRMFQKESGVPAKEKLMMRSGTPYNLKWIGIKNRVVNSFLSDIVGACKTLRPGIQVGINVYYESAIHPERGNEYHSQDLEGIASTGVDHIYLMMYHRQMKNELKLGREKIKTLFRQGIERALAIAGDRLVVKLEIWDWRKNELIPIEEMEQYIGMIPGDVERICFTPVKNADMTYLKKLLKAAKIEKIKGSG